MALHFTFGTRPSIHAGLRPTRSGKGAQVCPQVYKLDADGLVYLDSDVVPAGLEEEAREGAAACPAEALTVEAVA